MKKIVYILNIIKDILHDLRLGKDLKSKATLGTVWVGTGGGVEKFLRLVRDMILTRILAPEIFGVMAIVLVINSALESFTDVGISQAIVQYPQGEDRKYLNGAWWFSLSRGISLYFVAYLGAPWVAEFYGNPQLTTLMRVAFLTIVLNAAISPRAYIALKNMRFKRWVFLFNGGAVIGIISTMILAFHLKNVWALVIGYTIEAVSRCILSFVFCPYFPRFRFEKKHLQSLFKYAGGVVGLPILTYLFMNIDIVFIGKLCTTRETGLYIIVFTLAWAPLLLVTEIVGRVLLSYFSAIQTEKESINGTIIKLTTGLSFIGFPMVVFFFFYGGDVLSLLYGSQYEEAKLPFAILFSAIFFRTCSVPIATYFFASGRPELHRLFTFVRATVKLVLIYPAVKYFGLIGPPVAGLIAMIISYLIQVFKMRGITNLNIWNYGKIFLQGLLISGCVISVWILSRNLYSSQYLINIFMGIVGCLFAYFVAILVFVRPKEEVELLSSIDEKAR